MSVRSRSNRLAQTCPPLLDVDQLRGDPHPVAGLAHAALEHVADAERLGHVRHGDRCLLVDEGRVAGDDVQLGQLREIGDDVLADAVGEILLLGIAAHVVEREHGDRGLVGNGRRRRQLSIAGSRRSSPGSAWRNSDLKRIDPDRLGDVLELGLAEIADRKIEPRFHLAIGVLGQADRAGRGNPFQPRGDIDAVAHQVAVALLDDIAQMDADAELDAALGRQAGVALDHAVLHFDGAAHGVDDAAELDERPVAGALDDAAIVHGDGRIDQVAAQRSQPRQDAILVRAGEAAVADHIGDQDRRDFSRLARKSQFLVGSK